MLLNIFAPPNCVRNQKEPSCQDCSGVAGWGGGGENFKVDTAFDIFVSFVTLEWRQKYQETGDFVSRSSQGCQRMTSTNQDHIFTYSGPQGWKVGQNFLIQINFHLFLLKLYLTQI